MEFTVSVVYSGFKEIGKNVAKAKVLKNYYRSLDKRLDLFRCSLIELNGRVFETPANVE